MPDPTPRQIVHRMRVACARWERLTAISQQGVAVVLPLLAKFEQTVDLYAEVDATLQAEPSTPRPEYLRLVHTTGPRRKRHG